MRSQKRTIFFSLGRKWVFTLALFLLVFAVASVVKIQAAGNVTGWLWGGSEDANLGGVENCLTFPAAPGCIDGDETGVGWISMNKDNCDPDGDGVTEGGSTNNPDYPNCPEGLPITTSDIYKVTIPSGAVDGDLSGYAWNESLGWISFNESSGFPTVSSGDDYAYRARKVGDEIRGWARIMSFPQAGTNAGGWTGWIRLHSDPDDHPVSYGVSISGDHLDGYGWNGEESGSGGNMANGLGWISFNRTTIEEVCTLEFLPATKTMNENSTDDVFLQETSAGANCNCGNVNLAINNPVPPVVKSISPTLVDFSSPLGKQVQNIIVITDAVPSTATYNDVISASSTSCGTANLGLLVQNVPDCAISCPESIEVTPGGDTENIEISSTGTECGGLAVSTCDGTDGNITISGPTGGNCNASATSAATFRESTTATVFTNFGSCTTKVFVKRLGWIETNP